MAHSSTRRRYIFVVGGVMSGVGKGVTTASIGKILQSKGYRVTAIKIDPYINVDAGTMNPTEHGEVFVTDDGDETDQDVGNYERFLGITIPSLNYMTTGRVYLSVIQRERNLEYGGKCVEVVPHIPEEVISRIERAAAHAHADITLIEIGGTVGEYQNILFLEAARMMKAKDPMSVQIILVSYMPVPSNLGEMKTKPTQYATRTLNSAGLLTDFIIARGERSLDEPRRQKIATFCSIAPDHVISAPDVDSIYDVPLNFEKEKIGEKILHKFGLHIKKGKGMRDWQRLSRTIHSTKRELPIAVVGKYFATGEFVLADSYISVIEALRHAAWQAGYRPKLHWIETKNMTARNARQLSKYAGVVVPQGWGSRGAEGKIEAIRYVREHNIPYLGLCYGMQMAVIEFARHVLHLSKANSLEVDPRTPDPVIHIMPNQIEYLKKKQYGGTIRLGSWDCRLMPNTKIRRLYGKEIIAERHRHRYELNNAYRERLEKAGMKICGTTLDGKLVEAIELPKHPFFIGVQFHPEYKTQPTAPHPLFHGFIQAAIKRHKK